MDPPWTISTLILFGVYYLTFILILRASKLPSHAIFIEAIQLRMQEETLIFLEWNVICLDLKINQAAKLDNISSNNLSSIENE